MSSRRRGRKTSYFAWGILGAAAILCLLLTGRFFTYKDATATQNINSTASGMLEVQYIDVGQADASLVKLPNGKIMMIDAGGNATADKLVDYVKGQGISKIDYFIATHPHEDHIGGMDKVIDNFDVDTIYMPKVDDEQVPTTRTYEDVLTAIANKKLKVTQGRAGISVFHEDGLSADIIAPNSEKYEELNSYSIVVKLTYGNNRFLFMGDAEADSEKEMLEKFDVKADVIKCGHHGSSSSSSAAFIAAVKPQYAILSCGLNNAYGHPHQKTLDTLKKYGSEIYRTDEQQTITARSNGIHITLTAGGASCAA